MLALLGAPLLGSAAHADAAALPPFLATLHVGAPSGRVDDVSVGISPSATDGFDAGLDRAEPPAPPGGVWVSAYAVASERLARDVVGPAEARAWSLRVDAEGPAGALALAWDLDGFAPLPPRTGVDMTIRNVTYDALDTPSVLVDVPEGLSSVAVEVAVFPLSGSEPSPPRNLTAAPTGRPGEVALAWDAPADLGGHPLRRYVVYRDGEELARVVEPRFVDAGREVGSRPSYHVVALNRIGASAPSESASGVGTGKPAALDAGAPREDDARIAGADPSAPGQEATVEPTRVDLVRAHGEPSAPDPRRYELSVTVLGDEHHASAAAPIPQALDVALLDVPGASASTHGADAGFAVAMREGAPVLFTHARAGDASFADGTRVPLLP